MANDDFVGTTSEVAWVTFYFSLRQLSDDANFHACKQHQPAHELPSILENFLHLGDCWSSGCILYWYGYKLRGNSSTCVDEVGFLVALALALARVAFAILLFLGASVDWTLFAVLKSVIISRNWVIIWFSHVWRFASCCFMDLDFGLCAYVLLYFHWFVVILLRRNEERIILLL